MSSWYYLVARQTMLKIKIKKPKIYSGTLILIQKQHNDCNNKLLQNIRTT